MSELSDLEKLPVMTEENGIYDFRYTTHLGKEEASFLFRVANEEYLFLIENLTKWPEIFAEHCDLYRGRKTEPFFQTKNRRDSVSWNTDSFSLVFSVDRSAKMFEFSYPIEYVEQTRKIVDSFIDILWNGTNDWYKP